MQKLYKLLFLVYIISCFAKADADLEKQVSDMQDQIDALAEAVEEGGSSGEVGWWTKTSLGGYGEIHWSNSATPVDTKTTRATTSPANEVDIHRYVLFIGHEFNEYLNMNSEVEIEHAFVKDGNGELEMEQLYLEQNLAYLGIEDTYIKYGTILI